MHRIDGDGATVDNLFTEGDPGGGVEATVVTAKWANAVQEELCNVIEGEGLTLDDEDDAQLRAVMVRLAPPGALTAWPTETPPTGWLECDGSAISRTTYAGLFAVIGVIYGNGDGSTTFNVPDLRGRFLRGWDHGAGLDPDAASRTNRGDGTTGDHVGTKQADGFKSHNHGYNQIGQGGGAYDTTAAGTSFGTANTNASGGNETRPVNIAVMWCIKY